MYRKNSENFANDTNSIDYAERYFENPKMKETPCYLGYYGYEIIQMEIFILIVGQ